MRDIDRKTFLLHARMPGYQQQVARSLKILREFFAKTDSPHIAVSWGKDSLVCLHLALKINSNVKGIWFDRGKGGDLPEIYELAERLKNQWRLNLHQVPTLRSVWEIYEQDGAEAIAAGDALRKNMWASSADYFAKHPCDGEIMGLRAQEAKGRRANLAGRGLLFKKKSGIWSCNPIGYWSGNDVWAYLISNDIPYPPIYDDLAAIGIGYNHPNSRTANWAGLKDLDGVRLTTIKVTRPALYYELIAAFPLAANYASGSLKSSI